ncbi:hypothetical protein TraAM80_05137 [Trypanosoma rangeli]|uniref:Uncharacterized protein n=1 Tax=Trypanosoma rangeli TaxID=5698 RepID=A0A422NGH4_TRYRA|nr:uncharacterized protein TraAM80_05137 [Trypanosoma rangeli]RNF04539.1 hypothetical protein TraAM80_05137 [Trypanosoma rangeli]|eukprot:RNF04539.1 hypothetical protein TraAM80_05137 [Trypanosoma rangeli]
MHETCQAAMEIEAGSMRRNNRELFPNWLEDKEAPLHEFRRLPDALKRRYIVNRLTVGERRITHAADYGGLLMMQHLNLGELMMNETGSDSLWSAAGATMLWRPRLRPYASVRQGQSLSLTLTDASCSVG